MLQLQVQFKEAAPAVSVLQKLTNLQFPELQENKA